MKKILFLSVLLFSNSSFAFKEVPAFEQDLFLLKVQSTVIQNNEMISEAVTQGLAEKLSSQPELITDEDPGKLIEVLEQEFEKQISTGSKFKIVDEFKEKIHELAAEGRLIIRTQGISLGVMYISMELGNLIVAAAFVSAGHPDWAIAIGAIHYHEFLLMGKVALSKLLKIRKTYLAYGGKENYRIFKNLHKQVNRNLRLRGKEGVVVAVSRNQSGEFDAISMSKMGFVNKLFSRIYPNRHKLDLITLKHFLKKQGLKHDEKIEILLEEPAEDWVKIAFVVNHLQKSKPELFEALKMQFPNSMIEIDAFQISESLKQWSLLGLSAESQEDFLYFSSHVPTDVRVIDAIKIWSKCLYPTMLEESKNLGYFSYRFMVKHLSELDIAAEVHFKEFWNAEWTNRFNAYFAEAFGRSL